MLSEYAVIALAVVPYVVLTLLALVIAGLEVMLWHSPLYGLFVVLVAIFVDAIYPSFGVPVGVKLLISDVAAVMLLMPVLFRLPSLWKGNRIHHLWLFFGAVMIGSLFYGLLVNGTRAGLEVRVHFIYWAVASYFMSFPWSEAQARRLIRMFIVGMLGLGLIAAYRWSGMALGFGDASEWNEGGTSLRVLNYSATIALGLALILAVTSRRILGLGRAALIGVLPLGAAILVLQHRTAWVVLTSAAFVSAFLSAKLDRTHRLSAALTLGSLLLVVLLVIAWGKEGAVGESLKNSVQEVGSERSTLAWRTQSWQELIRDWIGDGPRTWAVGNPYGSGFRHWVDLKKSESDTNPHSNYVYLLLRVGALGTVGLVGSLGYTLLELYRRRRDPWAVLFAVSILIQLLGFVSYPSHYGTAFIVGMAFTYLRHDREAEEPISPRNSLPYRGAWD